MKKIIISVGNPLKSDDNIGNLIMDRLIDEIKKDDIIFIKGSTNPENFIEVIKKMRPDIIFFIDVAFFDGKTGDVKLFDLNDIQDANISTHNFPIKILQDFLPNCKNMLIGIKPKSLEIGDELSPEINNKFSIIIDRVKKIIDGFI